MRRGVQASGVLIPTQPGTALNDVHPARLHTLLPPPMVDALMRGRPFRGELGHIAQESLCP